MRGAWITLVACATLAACGGTTSEPAPIGAPRAATEPLLAPVATTPCGSTLSVLVPASDVVIIGAPDDAERELVQWALGRFDDAGLLLPEEIGIGFDDDREYCMGRPAICHPDRTPPEIAICEPSGEYAQQLLDRQIATLHELAHIWQWAQGDGTGWPDRSAIVGGEVSTPDTPWRDRQEERVAITISWGLLDQLRRPVGSNLPCSTFYVQFVALTGHVPLGPLEVVCLP